MFGALLCLVLIGVPPTVEAQPDVVDVDATREGIAARVGPRADGWTIAVGAHGSGTAVVTMTAPDGWVLDRQVTLDATDPQGRARQLAGAVAVVIDNYEPRSVPEADTPAPKAEPSDVPTKPAGFLALGGQLSTGPAARSGLAAGVSVSGGTWLLREHIMPMLELGWRRSVAGSLTVDGLNIDGGVAFGAPIAGGHVWVGGGIIGGALGGFARDSQAASAWSAHLAVPAIVQARIGPVFAQFHAGAEMTLPPLHFSGDNSSLRWGHLRATFGIRLGFLLARAGRFGFRPD